MIGYPCKMRTEFSAVKVVTIKGESPEFRL
jgi:hypothetical protein